MHMFFSKAAPDIAGFLDPTFWTVTVMQLAQTEPAIRYAAQAIGAMYASTMKLAPDSESESDDFTIETYNKAIRALVRRKLNSDHRTIITLTSCVLFICLEVLRGKIATAIDHIHSGLKLISEFSTTKNNTGNEPVSAYPTNPSDGSIIDDLKGMFSRLYLQASLSHCTQGNIWDGPAPYEEPASDSATTFGSLSEARDKLFSLATECVAIIRPIMHAKYEEKVHFEMIARQRSLERLLRGWRRTFESSIAVKVSMSTTRLAAMGNVLSIYAICMHLWVATSLSVSETTFDQYRHDFETVIALAESLLETGDTSEAGFAGAGFQFELGIIPPLQILGAKCRFPDLRQQILDLLKAAHWREGLFDSARSADFVELMRHIEDAGAVDDATGLPTEAARVHFANQFLGPGHDGQNAAVDMKTVILLKPEGPYGPWHQLEMGGRCAALGEPHSSSSVLVA